MSHSRVTRILTIVLSALAGTLSSFAQNAPAAMEEGFKNPPNSAKPRVWWHWMNGNITKEGIKLDLEWMNRVGIGGFQNFDASLTTPKLVDKRLVYMTPEWKDAFRYATTLADQLGLEEAIAGSPGWSESGGPWVKPNQGMKKVVWSETRIEGGKPYAGVLPHPPTVSGPIQNIPIFDFLAMISGQPPTGGASFYADVRLPGGGGAALRPGSCATRPAGGAGDSSQSCSHAGPGAPAQPRGVGGPPGRNGAAAGNQYLYPGHLRQVS